MAALVPVSDANKHHSSSATILMTDQDGVERVVTLTARQLHALFAYSTSPAYTPVGIENSVIAMQPQKSVDSLYTCIELLLRDGYSFNECVNMAFELQDLDGADQWSCQELQDIILDLFQSPAALWKLMVNQLITLDELKEALRYLETRGFPQFITVFQTLCAGLRVFLDSSSSKTLVLPSSQGSGVAEVLDCIESGKRKHSLLLKQEQKDLEVRQAIIQAELEGLKKALGGRSVIEVLAVESPTKADKFVYRCLRDMLTSSKITMGGFACIALSILEGVLSRSDFIDLLTEPKHLTKTSLSTDRGNRNSYKEWFLVINLLSLYLDELDPAVAPSLKDDKEFIQNLFLADYATLKRELEWRLKVIRQKHVTNDRAVGTV